MTLGRLIIELMRLPPEYWEEEVHFSVNGVEIPAGSEVKLALHLDDIRQLNLPFEEEHAHHIEGRVDR